MKENEISELIINLAIKVHSILGPGLLESVYEECLCHELKKAGLSFVRQQPVKLIYDGLTMDVAFRADIVVENKVIVELKSVREVDKVMKKILLTYLRIMDKRLGLLINFNEVLLKDGISRIVNNLEE
ncbi:MAG TPA: GxxExxY protein [Bacteroidales bacterium]|nr:GxxExxY protein [Bacteroidales bacterium]